MTTTTEVSGPERAQPSARPEGKELVPGGMTWEADPWAVHLRCGSGPRLLGYPEGQPLEEGFLVGHVHPDDWGPLLTAMYRAAVQGGVQRCEHRMFRADGSVFWAQTAVQQGLPNGSMTLAGLTVDITALKESEQRSRAAEADALLLIDNIRDYAVFMVSPRGEVMSWNMGAHRLKQYAADEMIGQPIARFFAGEDVDKGVPRELLLKAELDGRAEYSGWLLRKGGERFWGNVILYAITHDDGGLAGFAHIARDLTSQRQTEIALFRSEEHFRLLFRSVSDFALFVLSPQGLVESWDQGSQRLAGYRADEAIGAHLSLFFPPQERERHAPEQLVDESLVTGSATYEGWLLRKGGRPFWAAVGFNVIDDEQGRLRGISVVARDLSVRKQQEDALRESEERLRLLIHSLQEYGIFMLSPDGKVMSWSPGAERLKGYNTQEAMGLDLATFFPTEEREKRTAELLLQRIAVDSRAEYEGWMVRKNGSTFWASVTFDAVKNARGEVIGTSNVVRDLTPRMRAERAQSLLVEVGAVLAGARDWLGAVHSVAGLVTRGFADWCVLRLRADPQNEQLVLKHRDPQSEETLRSAVGARPPEALGPIAEVQQSGRSILDADASELLIKSLGITEPQLLRHCGARPYICVALQAGKKNIGAFAVVAPLGKTFTKDDLSLAEEIALRTALSIENVRLYDDAKRAVLLREEVLAVVSHDLRNPLMTIQMAALRLSSEQKILDDRDGVSRLGEKVRRAADRMTHLISDLLDFSNIEAGRFSLTMDSHSMQAIIADAVEMMQPIAAAHGLELRVQVEPEPLAVRCDRERLLQVFSNLIGNALKFTKEGSITVSSRTERDRIVFTVTDTGCGIADDARGRIFDRYWQVEHRPGGGTGLGLAISKAIIEAHGGSIWVESELGRGSTFFFSLPFQAPTRSDDTRPET